MLNFVDKVEQLYIESDQKEIPEDEFDQKGYLEFWNEWRTKRNKWK